MLTTGSVASPTAFFIAHLLPVNVSMPTLGTLAISTEYPFGDQVILTAVPAAGRTTPLSVRVRIPGWAVGTSVSVDSGAPFALRNGTVWEWNVAAGASSTALIVLLPEIRFARGWGVLGTSSADATAATPASSSSAPPTDAVAVYRGPLLFALQLTPQPTLVRSPAAGGVCEQPAMPYPTGGACKSADLAFTLDPNATAWNYALNLAKQPFVVERRPGSASTAQGAPFDPQSQRLLIRASARRVAAWTLTHRRNKANEPPPSPVDCAAARACGEEVTIDLIPFGATQTRIAAFPWYKA